MHLATKSKEIDSLSNLIFIKGIDKMSSVLYVKKTKDIYHITYRNNPHKSYPYSFKHIKIYVCKKPKSGTDYIIYKNTVPVSGVNKAYEFGQYTRLLYESGKDVLYQSNQILFEPCAILSGSNNNLFQYFKELSKEIGIRDNTDTSLLFKQFEKIKNISSNSALFCYLTKKLYVIKRDKQKQPYFPFGFNASQKSATKKALLNKISVIEGPPGTGKTQTILNILANAILSNKTVAVVSNNNSATDNVFEKLDKCGISFIAAPLGNSENKEKFFKNQNQKYPNMKEWKLNSFYIKYLKFHLSISGIFLDVMLLIEKLLANAEQTLAILNKEKQYYMQYYQTQTTAFISLNSPFFISSKGILKMWVHYQFLIENNMSISTAFLVKSIFWGGTFSSKFFNQAPELVIAHLQHLYYSKKEKELSIHIKLCKIILKGFSFSKSSSSHQLKALSLLKASLNTRYYNKYRNIFSIQGFKNEFSDFIKEYPIILSTTHSLKSCIPEGYLFDYVIVDEASQVDLVTGVLTLSCAKNIVIVGDTKQLPNIINPEFADKANKLFDLFSLTQSAYNSVTHSFLSSITELFPKLPKTLLREHYRCHPQIIEFCNQRFYNNELIVLSKNYTEKPLTLYVTASGNHARGTKNQRQIDVILEEILPSNFINYKPQSIGIISPYRKQANEIKAATNCNDLEIDTVHRFQGREKDIIILSTVSNQVNEFISKPDLLNVAVSRAVNKLIVVVANQESYFEGNSIIADLIRYIKYNNFEVVQSQLYSIFDLLYTQYSHNLQPLLKRLKNVSEFKSENLINILIEDVLSEERFLHLSHVLHVPLGILIRDTTLLTKEELAFAQHPHAHIDFIIFSKIDKRPLLAIEVDGYAFHEGNTEQLARDAKKDAILNKYNIPLIRFSTIGSNEKVKLIRKLEGIVDNKH